jgi:hypothetical protein
VTERSIHQILNYFIATIWLINGLFCKVLNFVPRHQEIVESLLDLSNGRVVTILIGISEIIMAFWILSGHMKRVSALFQIIVISTMNTLEFMLVPHLLLWGKLNSVFALLLIILIYFNEFQLNKKISFTILICFHS